MCQKTVELEKAEALRKEAEKALKGQTPDLQKLSTKDVRHLVHELQVHQIELEIQNEELRRAQSELEDSRNKYSNLYDFAPIGYFTFDKNGLILEVNLTGAIILGKERSFLIKKPFSLYTGFSSRDVFYLHLREVFRTNTRQTCEIKLVSKDGIEFDARLESLLVQESGGNFSQCRTAISDITARRQAEEATRESEERYCSLVESANDIIAMVSPDGIIISLNPAFERITGWAREEWLGKSFKPLIYPEDLPLAMEVFQHTMNGETVPSLELRLLANSGSYVDIEYVTTSLLKKGKVIGNLTVARDITERKRAQKALSRAHDELEIQVKERTAELKDANIALLAEITERKRAAEELRESEGRLQSILDNSSTVVFLKDLEGRYITVNRRFEELFHVTRQDVVGKSDYDIFPREHAENFRQHDLLALEKGSPVEIEEFVPHDDGLHVYISVKFPLFTAEEKPYAVCGIATDITERKRAEEALAKAHDESELHVLERTADLKKANRALHEARKYSESIIETLRESLVVLDADLRVRTANQTFYSTFKVMPEETEGIFIYDIGNRQWDIPKLRTLFEDIIPRNTKFLDFEVDHEFPGIGRKTMLLNARRIYYEGVDIKMILLAIEDITERKKLESQLLHSQRMESIGTLAGGIAHDLNNVLTPIMLSLELLKETFKDEQSRKMIAILERNSQRGADLLKQVLSFARGVEGERNPLQVKHIILEIQQVVKETFPRSIEIKTEISKDLFSINGDATQLYQVLMNLCVNARDAMPNGGILSLSVENFFIDENFAQMHTEAKVGSYVVITVSDTGTGISPKIIDRIFDPFFTTKGHGKGTGLGLSTSLGIVKSHGGFINVYSEVGQGTKFSVYLPAITTNEEQKAMEFRELPSGHGELVLLVDDEAPIREITRATLEAYGYKVITASDGAEAAALYAQNIEETRVVLMDMAMPNMDGLASIRVLRKINPNVKIIAASGLTEKEKLTKVADINANSFLPKPYTAEKLLKTIHEVLNAE